MKRSMLLAAALMLTGLTSVTFAHDEKTSDTPKNTPAVAPESEKPVRHHKVRTHHVVRSKKHTSIAPAPATAPVVMKDSTPSQADVKAESQPGAKTMPERVTENKPAATLSDAAKVTPPTAPEQAKEAVAKSVKSSVATPSLPTAPTAPVAKTITTPTSPVTPATGVTQTGMPTK